MQATQMLVAVLTYGLLFTEQYIRFMSVIVNYFGLEDLQYVSLSCNVIMSSRKYVTLEEAIDSLLGDDNVCSEQSMVILPPKQGDGDATDLKQGEDDVSHCLKTLPNDVAGWVVVCGDSSGKEYVASKASNNVGP